jgi:hypothetical protein
MKRGGGARRRARQSLGEGIVGAARLKVAHYTGAMQAALGSIARARLSGGGERLRGVRGGRGRRAAESWQIHLKGSARTFVFLLFFFFVFLFLFLFFVLHNITIT